MISISTNNDIFFFNFYSTLHDIVVVFINLKSTNKKNRLLGMASFDHLNELTRKILRNII